MEWRQPILTGSLAPNALKCEMTAVISCHACVDWEPTWGRGEGERRRVLTATIRNYSYPR